MRDLNNGLFANWIRKNAVVLMWIAIIIYPLLFLWQGLDFSDEGNALTIYQSIFSDPSSVSDTLGTYGTSVIGGIWLRFFGDLGVAGVRFAGALVRILTIIFAYFILKEYIDKKLLLLGFFVSFLFSYHLFTLTIIHYNDLSALFFVIAIFFLINGLKNNSVLSIFIAGLILVFNVFVRLPNLLGILFIFAIPLNRYLKKNISTSAYLKQYLTFLVGIFSGFFVVVYYMKSLGYYDYYIKSINYLLGAIKPHGPYSTLLFETIKGYSNLFGDAILLLLLIFFAVFLYLYLKLDRLNPFIKYSLFLPFLLLLYIKYNPWGVPIAFRFVELLAAMCYVVLIAHILNYKKNGGKDLSIIAFLILITLIVVPAASGARQINSLFVIPVAFPLVLSYIYNIKQIRFSLDISKQKTTQNAPVVFEIENETLHKVRNFLLIIFVMYVVVNSFTFTSDNSFNRFSLNAKINHKYLRGIHTTKEKAEPLNELISEFPKYIKSGDTILVTWIAPIIYYITDTRPYFPHPWTEIYKRDKVKKFLNESRENTKLPVIIRYNYSKKHEYDDILFQFFKKNSYEKKWGNGVYEIYTPNIATDTQ